MDEENGDDDRGELRSGWGGESRQECWRYLAFSAKCSHRKTMTTTTTLTTMTIRWIQVKPGSRAEVRFWRRSRLCRPRASEGAAELVPRRTSYLGLRGDREGGVPALSQWTDHTITREISATLRNIVRPNLYHTQTVIWTAFTTFIWLTSGFQDSSSWTSSKTAVSQAVAQQLASNDWPIFSSAVIPQSNRPSFHYFSTLGPFLNPFFPFTITLPFPLSLLSHPFPSFLVPSFLLFSFAPPLPQKSLP